MLWRLLGIVALVGSVRLCAQICCKEPEVEPTVELRKVVWAQPTALSSGDRRKLEKTLRRLALEWGVVDDCEYVREAYQNRGYFDAEPGCEPLMIPGVSSAAGRSLFIAYLFINVAEGGVYRLRGIRWKNAAVFSPEELSRAFPIVPGEIFDRSKIARGLEAVRNLYQARGYINSTPVPDARRNQNDHTIELEIDVDEGRAYHWGELQVEGMSDRDRRVLLGGWDALRGRPADYTLKGLRQFFAQYFRPVGHQHSLSEYATLHIDDAKKAVDVWLALTPNPALVRNLNKTLGDSCPGDRMNR